MTSATTPTAFTIKDQVQCTASLSPQNVVARKFSNNSAFELIRCTARINKDSFNHPVFDLSLGETARTGIFIKRGNRHCMQDKTICWSEFKIPSQALRELLTSSIEENSITNAGDTSAGQVTHPTTVIEYTCNVADSTRNIITNPRGVRCSDSGTIRFAKGIFSRWLDVVAITLARQVSCIRTREQVYLCSESCIGCNRIMTWQWHFPC